MRNYYDTNNNHRTSPTNQKQHTQETAQQLRAIHPRADLPSDVNATSRGRFSRRAFIRMNVPHSDHVTTRAPCLFVSSPGNKILAPRFKLSLKTCPTINRDVPAAKSNLNPPRHRYPWGSSFVASGEDVTGSPRGFDVDCRLLLGVLWFRVMDWFGWLFIEWCIIIVYVMIMWVRKWICILRHFGLPNATLSQCWSTAGQFDRWRFFRNFTIEFNTTSMTRHTCSLFRGLDHFDNIE